MIQDPVLEQPRTVYSTAGAAISSSCDFTADDAQHLANCMVRSCKALISYESFFRIVDFVLGLPKHKYTVEQRPSDVWKYDRKIWSHECVLYRLTVKHDATNYVYFFCMTLLAVHGLHRSELLKYLENIPSDGRTMEDSMTQTSYDDMLKYIGDIFEAVSALSSYDTPKSDLVRKHLRIDSSDVKNIEAWLGVLSEYANLLLRRCGLGEPAVFDMLKLSRQEAAVNHDHVSMTRASDEESLSLPASCAGIPELEPDAAGQRVSSVSSTHVSQTSLKPPQVHDLRWSHVKNTKYFICDRCTKRIEYANQSFPHYGDWVIPKRGQRIATFELRWAAGEDFRWFCMPCLAQTEGEGIGPHACRKIQEDRGLGIHAQNRAARFASRQLRGLS